MEIYLAELGRARAARSEATDARAIAALDAVILTLEWVIYDGGRAQPASVVSSWRQDPLDHDFDGKRGGSLKGAKATARKRK